MQTEQAFPASSASVGAARHFVVGVLGTWGHGAAVWAASLLVSELATNAVLHAGTPFTVSVSVHEGAVRLEVGDGVRRAPRQRNYGVEATTGRGIALLATLSLDWGVSLRQDGKCLWCELAPSTDLDDGPLVRHEAEPDLEAFLSPEDRDLGHGGRVRARAA